MTFETPTVPRRRVIVGLALGLILILGVLDHVTGFEISFFGFYLIPIGLIAWHCRRRSGVATAFACAVLWYLIDSYSGHIYTTPIIGVWNALIRFASFLVVVLAITSARSYRDRLAAANGELRQTVENLERSLARVRELQGNIQLVCAWTHRIKSEGRWMQFEEFLSKHLQLRFTHGISEEGIKRLKAEMEQAQEPQQDSPPRHPDDPDQAAVDRGRP
ncbi:MAG TPA: hypothetical protein VGA56_11235 [Opitutaceae bacterium]